jgi:predicted amidohydrolase
MYNAILFISRQGEIMGVHRKINITVQELLYHTRGDGGQNLRVFDSDLGKISGLICGEHYQPLLKQHLIMNGSQINCSLWPGYKGGAEELMGVIPVMTQALCVAGGLWGIIACVYIPEDKVPKNFYDNNAFDQTFGGSCIVNPFGVIVAGPETYKETIVYGDVDLKLNAIAKSIINLAGIYDRRDILRLCVREKEYEPVISLETVEAQFPWIGTSDITELKAKTKYIEERLKAIETAVGERQK